MITDAFRALTLVSKHPDVDSDKIGIMGGVLAVAQLFMQPGNLLLILSLRMAKSLLRIYLFILGHYLSPRIIVGQMLQCMFYLEKMMTILL